MLRNKAEMLQVTDPDGGREKRAKFCNGRVLGSCKEDVHERMLRNKARKRFGD